MVYVASDGVPNAKQPGVEVEVAFATARSLGLSGHRRGLKPGGIFGVRAFSEEPCVA